MQNSERHADMVDQLQPDIVKRINEESRGGNRKIGSAKRKRIGRGGNKI